jgi:hypothetical protein
MLVPAEKGLAANREFSQEHGHFDVPDTNKALQRWVMIQRDQYRSKCKLLTGCRLQKLKAIDFEWEPRQTIIDEESKIRPSLARRW